MLLNNFFNFLRRIFSSRISYSRYPQAVLNNIIANLPEHVYWKDINGIYRGCNLRQAQSAGFTSIQEMIGKSDFEMPWKEYAPLLRKIDLEVMKTGIMQTAEEPSISLKDGSKKIFLSKKSPLKDDNNQIIGILGISFDITSQKQLEEIIQDKKQQIEMLLVNIIANLPGHVYWKDKNGVFQGCNLRQAQSAGFTTIEDMIGKTDFDMPWKEQAHLLREVDVEIMQTGIPKTVEEISVLADGNEAIFLSKKVPLYQNNVITGVLGISFDITEQKQVEEKLQTTENKLKGMTLVASSIAHELRTPLRTIEAGAQNISNYLPPLISAYKQAKQAELEIESINPLHYQSLSESCKDIAVEARASFTMIDLLLANINFPNLKLDQPVPCSIVECVTEALKRYPLTEKERAIIHWLPEGDFIFNGDKLYVIHVLFNLLKNALYYLKASNKPDAIISIWITQNILHFKDTGTGIAAEDLPYVFDQFYSKTYHGAGVGLSFCKAAMTALKGEISCESEEGIYTEFMLKFPLA